MGGIKRLPLQYMISIDLICGSDALRGLACRMDDGYVAVDLSAAGEKLELMPDALRRMEQVARMTGAAMVYADYYDVAADGSLSLHPLIDCQEGALRDDFDFGKLLLIDARALESALGDMVRSYRYAAFYALRLALSRQGAVVRLNGRFIRWSLLRKARRSLIMWIRETARYRSRWSKPVPII